MRDIDEVFEALGRSKFRSRFKLRGKVAEYFEQKGLAVMVEHARGFVVERLGASEPVNDGKQTPMKNHPVFIAQHATGTCCRGCLAKWHRIPKGKALSSEQIDHITAAIERWLEKEKIRISKSYPSIRSGQEFETKDLL